MKNSLWSVIAIVCGIVGFLMGYSTSAYTGIRKIEAAAKAEQVASAPANPVAVPAVAKPAAGGYGSAPAVAKPAAGGYGSAPAAAKPAAGGYGAAPAAAPAPSAGGYGAPAPANTAKPATLKLGN